MVADIKCNILDWDYKIYPPEYFDFIHASPPCVEYSIAKLPQLEILKGLIKFFKEL